ncbi:DUF3540 domain-containing protein [Marinomonas transparens]|uniref:DUF3540 domain-containing protein n=1 Tax=Marinomonas transparens TaxID=2795388 RepID=A0A934N1Z1_9GAMM|nr:DUF3540 domain-containing protein [Marinomonas transparens]MBJ7539995.1 DUF3540 domain-containing protein [Marinomonas transparens]
MKSYLSVVNRKANSIRPKAYAHLYCGKVTDASESGNLWQLDHDYWALPATGLLLTPDIGDQVTFIEVAGQYYISQILHRPDTEQPLNFDSDRDIHWQAKNIHLTAREDVELVSLNRISMICKHGVLSMTDTLVAQAEHFVQKAAQLNISAKTLLRLHGKHQLITADEDVRIDGERINMG